MPASIVDAHAEALAYVAADERLSVLVRCQLLTRVKVIVTLCQRLDCHRFRSLLLRFYRVEAGTALVKVGHVLSELRCLIVCSCCWR